MVRRTGLSIFIRIVLTQTEDDEFDSTFLRVDGYDNELQHKSHNLPKMPCLRLGKNQ